MQHVYGEDKLYYGTVVVQEYHVNVSSAYQCRIECLPYVVIPYIKGNRSVTRGVTIISAFPVFVCHQLSITDVCDMIVQ